MKTIRYILLACCPFIFATCEDTGSIPAYIYVEDIAVQTDFSTQGTSWDNISDIHIFENGQAQGVYEMPVRFPIIGEGSTELSLIAGIKRNGISTTRVQYPFYDELDFTLDLVPTETDTITPVIQYRTNTTFGLLESFENSNVFTNINRSNTTAAEGSFSGKLIKDNTAAVATYCISLVTQVIPDLTPACYMELNYKSDANFNVGIIAIENGEETFRIPKITITPKEEWNKIYIEFTPEVNSLQADEYKFFFQVANPDDGSFPNVFLDNVKVLYFSI